MAAPAAAPPPGPAAAPAAGAGGSGGNHNSRGVGLSGGPEGCGRKKYDWLNDHWDLVEKPTKEGQRRCNWCHKNGTTSMI
eukprot:gene3574-23068_t